MQAQAVADVGLSGKAKARRRTEVLKTCSKVGVVLVRGVRGTVPFNDRHDSTFLHFIEEHPVSSKPLDE
jgi:hypothetical protein